MVRSADCDQTVDEALVEVRRLKIVGLLDEPSGHQSAHAVTNYIGLRRSNPAASIVIESVQDARLNCEDSGLVVEGGIEAGGVCQFVVSQEDPESSLDEGVQKASVDPYLRSGPNSVNEHNGRPIEQKSHASGLCVRIRSRAHVNGDRPLPRSHTGRPDAERVGRRVDRGYDRRAAASRARRREE